jgi:hypothetical protein
MRKPIIAAGLATLLSAAAAWAAGTITFQGSTYLIPPLAVQNYTKQSPTSGTLVFNRHQQIMQIGGGTTITALTIDLRISPDDGQINCFYTKPAITTLTLTAASGQTLNDAITSASATTQYCYLYSASNTSWDRVQ